MGTTTNQKPAMFVGRRESFQLCVRQLMRDGEHMRNFNATPRQEAQETFGSVGARGL